MTLEERVASLESGLTELRKRLAVYENASIRAVRGLERRDLVAALLATKGNKLRAAQKLGVTRRTFYRRLRAFGLCALDSVHNASNGSGPAPSGTIGNTAGHQSRVRAAG